MYFGLEGAGRSVVSEVIACCYDSQCHSHVRDKWQSLWQSFSLQIYAPLYGMRMYRDCRRFLDFVCKANECVMSLGKEAALEI